jgi:two-component system sensor histidine kinase/response regulator
MGGEISVQSTPGVGSVFEFSLSVGLQEAQPLAESAAAFSPAETFSKQSVLVLDDNARCRELTCAYLQSWGMKPVTFDSAAAALAQMATARAAGKPYRLALIDGTLPDVDAFKLAADTGSDKTSVLLLVDTTQSQALARAREQHRVHALVKPVSQSTLHDGIAALLNPQLTDREQIPTVKNISGIPDQPAERLDVLLVEDNAVNRKLATHLLKRMGHTVAEAHNGAIAVAMTAEHAYDVILMDMQMPVMDGLEATATIRARGGSNDHLPIIALTANAMSGDRERCIESGMDDYVSKPIEIAALKAALARVTAGRTNNATPVIAAESDATPIPASQPAPAATSTPAPANATSSIAESTTEQPAAGACYDRAEALGRACDDAELLAQIIDIYIEETPALMTELETLLAAGELERAFRVAHTIKGSSGNLSAAAAGSAARDVELLARAGDLDGARAGLPALQTAIAALIAALVAERATAPEQLACGALS